MSNTESEINKAFSLSDLMFVKEREKIISELKENLSHIAEKMNFNNLYSSGPHIEQRFKEQINTIKRLVNCKIKLDLEAINKIEVFITIDIAGKIYERTRLVIEKEIENLKIQINQFCSSIQAGSDVLSHMLNRIEDEKNKFLADTKRDIDIYLKQSELEQSKNPMVESILGIDFSQIKQFQKGLSDISLSLKSIGYPITQIAKVNLEFSETLKSISEEYKKLNFGQINNFFVTIQSPVIAESFKYFEKITKEAATVLARFKELSISAAYPFETLKHITLAQKNLLDNYTTFIPSFSPSIKAEPLDTKEQDRLDVLLERFNPTLKKKRDGAWQTFHSDNPDRLSQSANSMIELLNQIINGVCQGRPLGDFFKNKYSDDSFSEFTLEEAKWVEITVKWISETKDKLQRVKHHVGYRLENVAETLLSTTERLILIILE